MILAEYRFEIAGPTVFTSQDIPTLTSCTHAFFVSESVSCDISIVAMPGAEPTKVGSLPTATGGFGVVMDMPNPASVTVDGTGFVTIKTIKRS